MAAGDITLVNSFPQQCANGVFNDLTETTISVVLIDNSKTAVVTDTRFNYSAINDPAYGNFIGDVLNISFYQQLSNSVIEEVSAGKFKFSANPVTLTQYAGAQATLNAYQAIICKAGPIGFRNTNLVGFVDLGGAWDMKAASLTITWHASGIFDCERVRP